MESPDLSTPEAILNYAKHLEGMTFREVCDLDTDPIDDSRKYDSTRYKGSLGTLLEEKYFGYKANSKQEADFADAGVELKTTCYDVLKDGRISAGERLVITMVTLDGPIEDDFFKSHVWEKIQKILLIYYCREKDIVNKLNQRVKFVDMFTPSEADLKIIQADFKKIVELVKAGKAEELSEGMTNYLGACTKGATAAKSVVLQFYPPNNPAKKRAFCLKRQYMDYILNNVIIGGRSQADSIIKDSEVLERQSFEDYVISLISPYLGMTDREICSVLGLAYTGNKAQWSQIVYSILGVRGERAQEFEKAGISVRTVRVEARGKIKESLSLDTFEFKKLVSTSWENSKLREYFEETRFLFVSFKVGADSKLRLDGAKFWSMSQDDIDGPLCDCWERTKHVVQEGVKLTISINRNGGITVHNNLPKISDKGSIAHVRPHAAKRGYLLEDGRIIGNPDAYGDELPDGRKMTQQSFWLNSDYVYAIVEDDFA